MRIDSISQCVCSALNKTLQLGAVTEIKSDVLLKDDLGMDSMSSLTFLMTLEELIDGFIVDPDTLGAEHLMSVKTITDYVMQQLAEKHL